MKPSRSDFTFPQERTTVKCVVLVFSRCPFRHHLRSSNRSQSRWGRSRRHELRQYHVQTIGCYHSMRLSLSQERTTMKRMLLVISAAVLFVTTLIVPTAAKADGGPGGTGCGKTMCKPQLPFVTTFAVPTAARADGGVGGTGCGNTICKPQVPFVTTFVVPTAASTDGGPGGTGCGTTMCKPHSL
jgi:hypothetical protein